MSKHPLDRRIFFTGKSDCFLSLNEILILARTGELSLSDYVFDTDCEQFAIRDIVEGKAPDWAVENDPMEHGLSPLSEADIALADTVASEDGFLEMPIEPAVKSVKTFLSCEPRIAQMVAEAERGTLRY